MTFDELLIHKTDVYLVPKLATYVSTQNDPIV
jgi:hypothetical protein